MFTLPYFTFQNIEKMVDHHADKYQCNGTCLEDLFINTNKYERDIFAYDPIFYIKKYRKNGME
jgi:hypothetical protein